MKAGTLRLCALCGKSFRSRMHIVTVCDECALGSSGESILLLAQRARNRSRGTMKLCAICGRPNRRAAYYVCHGCARIEFAGGTDPLRGIYVRPASVFYHWINGRWTSARERDALITIILSEARAA